MPADPAPDQQGAAPADAPEFGPGGYLPARAARRARKIVLREEMSLGWPLASLAAGAVVLVAGAVFWLRGGAPDEPFDPAVALAALEVGDAAVVTAGDVELLLVRAPGAVRAFRAPDEPAVWCGASDRLESRAGTVWQLDGRRVGGAGASLTPVPVEVHEEVVYAAPDAARRPVPPADRGEAPACADPARSGPSRSEWSAGTYTVS